MKPAAKPPSNSGSDVSELTARVLELEAERERSQEALVRSRHAAADEIARLHEQIDAIEQDREHLLSELERSRAIAVERDRLREWFEQVDEELATARERAQELEEQNEALRRLNARMSLEGADLRHRLEHVTRMPGSVQEPTPSWGRIGKLEAELRELAARLEEERERAQREIAALQTELARRRDTVEGPGEVERLREAVQRLEADRSELAARLAAAVNERHALRRTLDELRRELPKVETELVGAMAGREALAAELRRLQEQLSVAQAELRARDEQAARQRGEHAGAGPDVHQQIDGVEQEVPKPKRGTRSR